MGSATAWALATRGADVTLLERFERGHKNGSSHGTSRIFRFSYHDPKYVAMAQEALPLWRSLEKESGSTVLVTTGGLDMGKDMHEHVAALEECGARYDLLDENETKARWPYLVPSGKDPLLYQPDAGIVRADAAWSAFRSRAASRGARLKDREPVIDLRVRSDSVQAITESGAHEADTVVVTAGAWGKELLTKVGVDLPTTPTRETVAYYGWPLDGSLPSLVSWSDPAIYVLGSGEPGFIKAGEHHAGPAVDPDTPGEPDQDSVDRISEWIERHLPSSDPVPRSAETCLYTNTPDEDFILARHGRVVVGSPCSGHGFKFAPLIGKRLADLVLQ